MDIGYRVLFLGSTGPETTDIWRILIERVRELGLDPHRWLLYWSVSDFQAHKARGDVPLPLAVIYWGNPGFVDREEIEDVAQRGLPVFPVVSSDDKDSIRKELPSDCQGFQCSFRDQQDWQDRLVNGILETFSLLRDRRRIFISYKRDETSAVAHQLFDALNGIGYRTFLDTAEIVPGHDFQTVLMHQLMDSDLLVLLDSPNLGRSDWVKKELDQAEDHGIGILRLTWPDNLSKLENWVFWQTENLPSSDFDDSEKLTRLVDGSINRILSKIERMRTQAVGRRMISLQGYCRDRAVSVGLVALHFPNGLMLQKAGKPSAWLRLVAGVPVSLDFYQLYQSLPDLNLLPSRVSLFFNSSGIDPFWKGHLDWLNRELPILSLDQVALEEWLRGIP
ncbi:MAG: hypothetical protein HW380_1886 [Magnetococcales bacterium]|nr:hypothetical protein [Magnetococcales bacterium]